MAQYFSYQIEETETKTRVELRDFVPKDVKREDSQKLSNFTLTVTIWQQAMWTLQPIIVSSSLISTFNSQYVNLPTILTWVCGFLIRGVELI